MKRLVVVLCLVVAGCAAPVTRTGVLPSPSDGTVTVTTPPSTVGVPVPRLSPHGKDVLVKAREAGAASVVLVVSTEAGATERAAAALRDLGGVVEATDASIGYVRVSVPVGEVERVLVVDGVRQVDVDEPLSWVDPTP